MAMATTLVLQSLTITVSSGPGAEVIQRKDLTSSDGNRPGLPDRWEDGVARARHVPLSQVLRLLVAWRRGEFWPFLGCHGDTWGPWLAQSILPTAIHMNDD